jgi:CubicO group peptidase (beta-lactamase class C family)
MIIGDGPEGIRPARNNARLFTILLMAGAAFLVLVTGLGVAFLLNRERVTVIRLYRADPIEVEEGLPVQFSVGETVGEDVIRQEWDFGDGNTVTGHSAVHTFSEPGTYTVTFSVVHQSGEEERTVTGVHVRPYWPTQSWRSSTPEEQSMDSVTLDRMMQFIEEEGFNIYSVIVVRNGYIVLEEYLVYGVGMERQHHVQSVTKSFTSVLIGIAIHEGFIEGVDERLENLFPDNTIANMDSRKEGITLEHLLTMSVGMDWHELDYPYTHPNNTLGQMWVSQDAVQHVLDRPMVRDPGAEWAYNSGASILLGGVLEEATDQDLLSFAREYLFDPIGIGEVYWSKTTGDHYHTDGGLYVTPRDMARFGYLMLNNGTWDGREIVSADWVSRSTTNLYQTPWGYGYGYQWWTLDWIDTYAASGHYDQWIYVTPEENLVVIFTADIADEDVHPTDMLVQLYILPACVD